MMKVYIETERLIFRDIIEDDYLGLFELDSDPEVHKYLGNNPVINIQQSKDVVKFIQNQYKKNKIGRWAIIEKSSNEFIGWGGLKYEEGLVPNFNYYDLGYRLIKKYWGKGYATENAIASLKYGFETKKLNEIFAAAHIDNFASNNVIQKVGLEKLKTFDLDGELHNWYRISKKDWEKK